MVYEYKSETLWLWHIGGDLWNPWAIYLVGEHRDAIHAVESAADAAHARGRLAPARVAG